jgi:formate dehydrogenase subunit delta
VRSERLVTMANDIGHFFAAEADKNAGAQSVANHIKRYWDPRMRREIVAHYKEKGGAGLDPIARSAVALLASSA